MSAGWLGVFYVVSFAGFLRELSLFIVPQFFSGSRLFADLKLPALYAKLSIKGEK
jgi:hypothetical protein